MSNYNWCHNPDCHTYKTLARVRGTGDNKVLRTMKIKVGRYNWNNDNTPSVWDYFCNQNCLMQFLCKFGREIANTYSVKQPSETPIKVETKTYDHSYSSYYNGRKYKEIKVVNE